MKDKKTIFENNRVEKFARALIRSGHDQAAASFSLMVRQKVVCGEPLLRLLPNQAGVLAIKERTGPLTIITTDIIGELKGKSYFLLNAEECNQIYNLCTGGDRNKPTGLAGDEVLKELDNILSAAVITRFSNCLKITIYGDVPRIWTGENKDFQTMIRNDLSENLASDTVIVADVKFTLKGCKNFRPRLIWKLAEPFYSLIQQQAIKEYQNY